MTRWAAALLLAGCGGAVCGNGVIESGEQCDDGNTVDGDGCSSTCRAEPTVDTFVHWTFIASEFLPFDGESCDGVGADQVELTLSGPKMFTQKVDCSFYQYKFSSLPKGGYTVKLSAYDSGGAALTMGLASTTFDAAGTSQDVTVDVPFEDFGKSYQGTYFFQTRWGGEPKCAQALPPVEKELLLLERDGTPLAGMTLDHIPIDGSKDGLCQDSGGASQAVTGLDWGPAKITVTGEAADGTPLYRKTFDTFVGAGLSNPTAVLDVPSLLPDAGVPDAGVPDAAPGPDAG